MSNEWIAVMDLSDNSWARQLDDWDEQRAEMRRRSFEQRTKPIVNEFIMAAPVFYAEFDAFMKFSGHNWRRIKREMNKAAKKARARG